MAYVRVYYRANFDPGMGPSDKADFLEQQFQEGCEDGLGGVIIGRPSDGTTMVLAGEKTAVDAMVDRLDTSEELVDQTKVAEEPMETHDEGLALYLEDAPSAMCNYD